jgi:MOSC domain-containing protein YiiM
VTGRVEAIYLGVGGAGELPVAVARARAVPGRGLENDRYFRRVGTFWQDGKSGQDLTLIEAEALDALRAEGVQLPAAAARRNVVTRGIALNDLVGRRFRVGAVECLGRRLCEPCAHLAALTDRRVLPALVNRGGLRADVVKSADIRTGDEVAALALEE